MSLSRYVSQEILMYVAIELRLSSGSEVNMARTQPCYVFVRAFSHCRRLEINPVDKAAYLPKLPVSFGGNLYVDF